MLHRMLVPGIAPCAVAVVSPRKALSAYTNAKKDSKFTVKRYLKDVEPPGLLQRWVFEAVLNKVRADVKGMCAVHRIIVFRHLIVLRRMVFGAIVLALFIGALGSIWMVFHMAYYHGGINLNAWFFKNAPQIVYQNALRNLDPTGVYWEGLSFFAGGGVVMTAMMWARQRFPWWPFHPIGFPIGANGLMDKIWFSIFIAWVLKWMLMKSQLRNRNII